MWGGCVDDIDPPLAQACKRRAPRVAHPVQNSFPTVAGVIHYRDRKESRLRRDAIPRQENAIASHDEMLPTIESAEQLYVARATGIPSRYCEMIEHENT